MSLARRKEIYLELHPETAKNVAGAHASNKAQGNSNNASDTMSFASDTSKKTGKSKRTVERKASNGKKLKGMVAAIKAAGIDDSRKCFAIV